MISLDPNDLGVPERYKLIIGTVVPRPIAFVSTCSPDGKLNLAPFSYFNAVCTDPPTILFCPSIRGTDGEKKDTLRNIEATKEFVVNIVSEEIVNQMNATAADFPYGVSEFEQCGLTPLASIKIKPPRVAESPAQMECKLQQIIQVGEGARGSGFIVLGTVVQFHYQDHVYKDGRVLLDQLKPVARLAGNSYALIQDPFDLPRPSV